MTDANDHSRRTVLKTICAGVVGSAAIAGVASANNGQATGKNHTYTWADDTLYEMLESEPPAVQDKDPGTVDSEGNINGMEPIFLVGSMDDFSGSENVDGTEHSPHPNPDGFPIDHVVGLPPKYGYSAQWHVHLVVRPGAVDEDGNLTGMPNLNKLPHGDGQGNILTSRDTIEAAIERDDRYEIPLFHQNGDPVAFTCPVRPHHHKKKKNK